MKGVADYWTIVPAEQRAVAVASARLEEERMKETGSDRFNARKEYDAALEARDVAYRAALASKDPR